MPARGRNEDGFGNPRGTVKEGECRGDPVAGASLGVAPTTGTAGPAKSGKACLRGISRTRGRAGGQLQIVT